MPVDAKMLVVETDDLHMRIVRTDGTIKLGVKRGDVGYISHFVTCDDPDRFRRRLNPNK